MTSSQQSVGFTKKEPHLGNDCFKWSPNNQKVNALSIFLTAKYYISPGEPVAGLCVWLAL